MSVNGRPPSGYSQQSTGSRPGSGSGRPPLSPEYNTQPTGHITGRPQLSPQYLQQYPTNGRPPSDGMQAPVHYGSRPNSGGSQPGGHYAARPNSNYSRPPSQYSARPQSANSRPPTQYDSRPVSANAVDLDASRLSAGSYSSSISTVTLGGSSYPIGSTIGSSGLFVIGDPGRGKSKRSPSSQSISTNHSIRHLIVSQGYDFEDWNWPVIRFTCLLILLCIMVALLAATVGLAVAAHGACFIEWKWWQGSALYRIAVSEFYDLLNRDFVGDLPGVQEKIYYLQYLGVEAVVLSNVLPSTYPFWDNTIGFDYTDVRVGTMEDAENLIKALHYRDIKVMLEIDPLHTGIDHPWFQDSRIQTSTAGSIYREFYIWEGEPGVGWQYDLVRNQWYQHLNDTNKPVLNWGNHRLHEEFKTILEMWLELGFDGFYMKNVDRLYGATDATLLSIIVGWHNLLEQYSDSDGERALMVPEALLDRISKNSPDLIEDIAEYINLLDFPLVIDRYNMSNSIAAALERCAHWQAGIGSTGVTGPWISWRWTNMTTLSMGNWSAIEMMLLMLPGTPSLIAGQEVGRDPEVVVDVTNNDVRLITWSSGDDSKPYQEQSILDITTLGPLTGLIQTRQEEVTIRSNWNDDGDANDPRGYAVLDSTSSTMLLKRYFQNKDTYYLAINYGDVSVTMDYSDITHQGLVVTDTSGELTGNLRFDSLEMAAGQAIIMKVSV